MDPIWASANNISTTRFGTTKEDTLVLNSLDALNSGFQTFLIILYSITALLAFTGNVTVIFVLSQGKRCPKSLRKFLINLSMADVSIALFSIPFTYTDFMFGRWIFPRIWCPFAQFVQVLSVFVSVFTLTTIGIERYYATLHSFNCANYWFKHHTNLILIVGWILGTLLGSIQWFHSKTIPFRYRNITYIDCREEWDELEGKIYTIITFLVTFLLPLIILAYTYGAIGLKLFNYKAPNNSQSLHSQANNKSKVIKMMFAVWLLFVLCWAPIQIFILLLAFRPSIAATPSGRFDYYVFVGSYFACHWIAMANSCLNPFIYCFMSANFRKDFIDLKKRIYRKFMSFTTLNTSDAQ